MKKGKIISTVVIVPVIFFGTWGIISCGGIGIICGAVFMFVSTVGLVKVWV